MNYLYPQQLLYLYRQLSRQFGGAVGLRDRGLLESAVYRPQATFAGHELYPDLFSKAAALGHSLIANHPFVDGNKRVGYAAMRLMLRLNGRDLQASADAKVAFVVAIASGKMTEQAIADWLRRHSRSVRKRAE